MGIELTRDAEAFETRVGPFLAERVERNLPATVLRSVRERGAYQPERPPLFAAVTDDGTAEIVAVAMRAPPWPLVVTGRVDPAVANELLVAWLELDPDPGAALGEVAGARALAACFEALTGGRAELEFEEALHALSEVRDPLRPTVGSLRPATEEDRPTLIEWERAFIEEARVGDPAHAAAAVDRRIAAGFQFVWADPDGTPVSMLGRNFTVAGSARIGPVYTPPQHRRHGYASAAVAALSRRLLAEGAKRCLLFTDLANPTSNRIYADVGYVRDGAWEQYRLTRLPRPC